MSVFSRLFRPVQALPSTARFARGLRISALALACASPELCAVPLDPSVPLRDLLITRWTVDDGLPTNSLQEIGQSPDGFLWASSYSGLIRFDGTRFRVIDRDHLPFLTTDGFSRLRVDHTGRFWVGTRGDGLLVYDRGRLEPFGAPLAGRPAVLDLLVDRDGRIWIGTLDRGAFTFEDGVPVPVAHPAVRGVTVGALAQDARGDVWIGTLGKGLTRVGDGAYETFTSESGLASDKIAYLLADADGLWIGTSEGLQRFDHGKLSEAVTLPSLSVTALLLDAHGSLWIGTDRGLWRRHGRSGKLEGLQSFEGEALRGIGDLLIDREGSLWMTTFAAGLLQLRDSAFTNFTTADGLPTDLVDTICERRSDEYWVGAYDGTLHRIEGDRLSTVELGEPLPDTRVRHIYRDRYDDLWIASDAGLLHLAEGRETLYTVEDGLPDPQIRLVHEDHLGRLWVGTGKGLARHEGNGRFSAEPGKLASAFVLSIEEDSDGRLLVGTRGGLLIRDADGTVATYGAEEGMPGSVVFSTLTDDRGDVWLATNGGLGRLHRGEIRELGKRQGLPIDSVFDFKIDTLGNMWLSSAIGMIRVPLRTLRAYMDGRLERIDAEIFDDQDGMPDRECVGARKILQAEDGRLWVPTLGGVARVDPRRLPYNTRPPPVIVEELRIDGRAVDLPESGAAHVAPGVQRIELRFAAPTFVAASRARIAYILEGFDDDWIGAGDERTAAYTSLPPGSYAFRVTAANSDGVWSREEAALPIVVHPYFFQRPGFYLLCGGFGFLGVAWLFRRRVAAVHRRNDRLKQLLTEHQKAEKERDKLIAELEAGTRELEQLSYSFSHDLKTPLVTIQGFVGWLEEDLKAGRSDRVRTDLERIRAAADRMNLQLNGLRELLSLRRRGGDRRHPLRFGELAREAVDERRAALEAAGARVEIEDDLPEVRGNRPELVQALGRLIDNGVKFAAPGRPPELVIGARRGSSPQATLFVRDNGIGLEPEHGQSIFGLFHRLDPDDDGLGLGLVLVERIVKAHGGRIWVESPGRRQGSTFFFTLPVP